MKTIADLNAARQKAQEKFRPREKGEFTIMVGMATCGIAAGARPVMEALQEELKLRGIHDTDVTMTGCIGVCRLEPMIEVIDNNGDKVTYVKMDPAKAKRVIAEHIVNGRICLDLTVGAAEIAN